MARRELPNCSTSAGVLWLASLALLGCATSRPPSKLPATPQKALPALEIISPAEGAILPRNLTTFELAWNGGGAGPWQITLAGAQGIVTHMSTACEARELEATLAKLGAGSVDVRVCDTAKASALCGTSRFTIIDRELSDDVVYRIVEPRFNLQAESEARLFRPSDISVWRTRGRCVGCHEYANGHAAFNVRQGLDRRLFVFEYDKTTARLLDVRKLGEFSFMAWSPDGRYLALVVDSQGLFTGRNSDFEPFELFYRSGDLAIYDTTTKAVTLVPGASSIGLVEDMPAFCPDGSLVFVGYASKPEPPIDSASLYELRLSNGKLGSPRLLLAAKPGEFDYLPACSPNNRFVSFVRGDGRHGVFARQTSDIYVMPRTGGTPKKLSLNTEGVMDSWHRWSRDSHWLVFASQRAGARTSLYLSFIDDNGESAPPVRLVGLRDRKVNQPELVAQDSFPLGAREAFARAFDEAFAPSSEKDEKR
jgi:dipeptidyl aminopeptidase/acylaminoacyl peptidase